MNSNEAKETYNDGDSIKCPACGEVYSDLSDDEMGDEDFNEIDCEGCGATLELSCSVSVSYRARIKS